MTDDRLDELLARIPKIGIDDWLAYCVEMRRRGAGLSQKDLQELGGPSEVTVRNIENSSASPSKRTLAKLDVALNWPPGLAAEIAGKAPRRAEVRVLASIATDVRTQPHPPERVLRVGGGSPTGDAQLDAAVRVSSLAPLSYEELWRQWVDLYLESAAIEMEYSRRRGRTLREGRDELWNAFTSAQQAGHESWEPPWEADRAVASSHDVVEDAGQRREGQATARLSRVDSSPVHAGEDPLWTEYKATRKKASTKGDE